MSSYLLKVFNESKGSHPFLVLGDSASHEHVFTWNDEAQAYCYEPANQQESDDIVSTNWLNLRMPWRVGPVMIDGLPQSPKAAAVVASTARIPPYVRPELYANYPLLDLSMMFTNEGIAPEGNLEDVDNMKRQLHRYYEGRAWAIEENRRLKGEVARLTEELSARKANDGVAVVAPDPVILTPAAIAAPARAVVTPPKITVAVAPAPAPVTKPKKVAVIVGTGMVRGAAAREARRQNAAARRAAKKAMEPIEVS